MWNNQLQSLPSFPPEVNSGTSIDAFDPSLLMINNYDVNATWQKMVQEQQRQLALQQQQQALSLSSFYANSFDQYSAGDALSNSSYGANFPNPSGRSNSSSQMMNNQNPFAHQTTEKFGACEKMVMLGQTQPSSNFNLAASVVSEHYGSTSCEESDNSDIMSSFDNNSPSICSRTILNNDDASRKRKQYWRQVWYRERNKEYSRNWRSKKKQEEESLKSEINELRAFREMIEETVCIHVHSCKDGMPFTYASKSFKKLIESDERNFGGEKLLDMIHCDDLLKMKQVLAEVISKREEKVISYRITASSKGRHVYVSSKIRFTNRGIAFVTSKDQ